MPRVEIIHWRETDSYYACAFTVFVDGEEVLAEVYDIRPEIGNREKWDEMTALQCAVASPAAAKLLKVSRDDVAGVSSESDR